jgi:hypothetical protein
MKDLYILKNREMQVYTEFNNFITNVFNNKPEFKTYFDSYTTFLITMKYDCDDIKNKRMNLLINYYYDSLENPCHSIKYDCMKYYETYIVDDFKLEKICQQVPYNFTEEEQEQQDEDTQMHYRDYFARYDYNKKESNNDTFDENEEYYDNDDNTKYSEISEDNSSDMYSLNSLYEYSDDYDEYYDEDI